MKFLSSQKKRFFHGFIVCTLSLFFVTNFSYAQNNECNIGMTLFRNVGYGAAVGAGVGALVAIANKDSKNIGSRLAVSGLIGAGVGGVISVIQIAAFDCRDSNRGNPRRSRSYDEGSIDLSPTVTYMPPNKLSEIDNQNPEPFKLNMSKIANNLGMGLQMTYTLPQ